MVAIECVNLTQDPLVDIRFGHPADVIMHGKWFANNPVDELFLGSIGAGQPTTTIPRTMEDKNLWTQASKSDSSHVNTTYTSVMSENSNGNLVDQKTENEDDEFAELDAWFGSGTVEIL